jgi:hypothetical protein
MAQQTQNEERADGVSAHCPLRPRLERSVRWQLDPVRHESRLVALLARLDEENRSFLDFHILPDVDRRRRFHLYLGDPWLKRGQPLYDLNGFCEVVNCVNASAKA